MKKLFEIIITARNFEYGWGGICRYSWRVPDCFDGRCQVHIDIDLGLSETEQEETWHMI